MSNQGGRFYKNSVNLYKSNGKFYYAYDENAWVMSYIFGYKLLDNGKRVGFPDNALENVKDELDGQKVSYVIIRSNEEPYVKDYHKLNTYFVFLKEAKKYVDETMLLDEITKKISKLDLQQLKELVEVIDEYLRKI